MGEAAPEIAFRLLPRVRPAGGRQRHLFFQAAERERSGCRAAQTRCGAERKQQEQKKVTQTRFKIVAGFHSSLWIK